LNEFQHNAAWQKQLVTFLQQQQSNAEAVSQLHYHHDTTHLHFIITQLTYYRTSYIHCRPSSTQSSPQQCQTHVNEAEADD